MIRYQCWLTSLVTDNTNEGAVFWDITELYQPIFGITNGTVSPTNPIEIEIFINYQFITICLLISVSLSQWYLLHPGSWKHFILKNFIKNYPPIYINDEFNNFNNLLKSFSIPLWNKHLPRDEILFFLSKQSVSLIIFVMLQLRSFNSIRNLVHLPKQ